MTLLMLSSAGTQLCILVLVLQGLFRYWYCRYWYCRYWYCCTILVVVGVLGVHGCISHSYTPHFIRPAICSELNIYLDV